MTRNLITWNDYRTSLPAPSSFPLLFFNGGRATVLYISACLLPSRYYLLKYIIKGVRPWKAQSQLDVYERNYDASIKQQEQVATKKNAKKNIYIYILVACKTYAIVSHYGWKTSSRTFFFFANVRWEGRDYTICNTGEVKRTVADNYGRIEARNQQQTPKTTTSNRKKKNLLKVKERSYTINKKLWNRFTTAYRSDYHWLLFRDETWAG